ncbi:MAG: RdgB/HAM1 family non-canonical purine NTP pyrophosphatase [Bacteroidetes bacterium]|nr:RdgB/HAM1 family non-canonical purine NTP pyrophosphatase [Bacteroidota bacterium]
MKLTRLLIASNNLHKIKEISDILAPLQIEILSLKDFPNFPEVEETGSTLEENSLLKAKTIFEKFNVATLADDTGLFVDALNGQPGVYSARYAGENATYKDNCDKLLLNLKDVDGINRTAKFESVQCLYINETEHYFFKGIVEGKIIKQAKGDNGFGYDPLFIPKGFAKTYAEMGDEKKNDISHRALALKKFKKFLSREH